MRQKSWGFSIRMEYEANELEDLMYGYKMMQTSWRFNVKMEYDANKLKI